MKRYRVVSTKQYRKDFKRILKAGLNRHKLDALIDLLASGEPIPVQYHDHVLKGGWDGARVCHIAPDWLLVYVKDSGELMLLLLGTGTHRDVLGIE